MATKKAKAGTKTKSKAKAATKPRAAKKVAKKAAKKAVKKAKSLLGRIAQVSAQLVLDSGVLGEAPKRRAPAKKRARKA